MLITWICQLAADKQELQPSIWRLQALSLQLLPKWQSDLNAIVLEMEKHAASNLAGEAGDDDQEDRLD